MVRHRRRRRLTSTVMPSPSQRSQQVIEVSDVTTPWEGLGFLAMGQDGRQRDFSWRSAAETLGVTALDIPPRHDWAYRSASKELPLITGQVRGRQLKAGIFCRQSQNENGRLTTSDLQTWVRVSAPGLPTGFRVRRWVLRAGSRWHRVGKAAVSA